MDHRVYSALDIAIRLFMALFVLFNKSQLFGILSLSALSIEMALTSISVQIDSDKYDNVFIVLIIILYSMTISFTISQFIAG